MRAIRHSEGILGREFSTFNTEFLQFSVSERSGRAPEGNLAGIEKALTDQCACDFATVWILPGVFYSAEPGRIYRFF